MFETPPLELPPPPSGAELSAWVATLWRDPTARSGWAACRWAQAERGWTIPAHLAVGDVLEFGLVALYCEGGAVKVLPGWERRWYGWLRYVNDLAVVVEGPFPDAPSASGAGAATVAELRLRQLPPLDIDTSWVDAEATDDVGTET